MTFQVALIGSDGLVVGSDELVNRVTPNSAGVNPTIEIGKQKKYILSDDGSLVCFFAGASTSQNIASTIAALCAGISLSDLKWERKVRTYVNRMDRMPGEQIGDQVIVVRRHDPGKVWVVQRPPAGPAIAHQFTESVCTGNNTLAKFLPRHLWNPRLKIAELKKLALLTLSYAAKENPGSIGPPFDIMTLDRNGNLDGPHPESGDAIFAEFDGKLTTSFDQL